MFVILARDTYRRRHERLLIGHVGESCWCDAAMPRVSYEDLLNSATTVIAENEGFRKRIDELVGQERET